MYIYTYKCIYTYIYIYIYIMYIYVINIYNLRGADRKGVGLLDDALLLLVRHHPRVRPFDLP